jgi:peptidoglycan/xylan/chitin deacetylase (PgdA/CDA1 family)
MKSLRLTALLAAVFAAGMFAWSQLAAPGTAQAQLPAQQTPQDRLPGTKLTPDQLKAQFFHVSAGKRLRPKSWPNGAKVAVTFGFDIDNASGNLARGDLTLEALSRGEYGAIDGLPRVLRLLDKHAIPATFFVPAVSAILHPQMIPDILAKNRHEIGAHGWIHENLSLLDEAEEKRLLQQSIDYLTKTIGRRPIGFRSPGASFSSNTIRLLKEAGFLYESTLMASDDAYELLIDGQPSALVELPIEWILDDAPYFARAGALPSPELIFQVYQDEFDVAYEEGGLYVLTMHPHIIGHRSRITRLDRLVAYMKAKPGVWFATHEEIVNYVKRNAGTND